MTARLHYIYDPLCGWCYGAGLLLDPTLILESRPPIAAMLAAQSIDASKALPMLHAIQHAHYEHGRRVVERDVLEDLAAGCGLDGGAFRRAYEDAPVDAHIAEAHALMRNVGARGFPTFVLEIDGRSLAVPHGRFASDPRGFADSLREACSRGVATEA